MARLTMLGTGNFLAPPGRYWNSFLVESDDVTVLFEPSPSVLPSLRRVGVSTARLDAIVVSHFHPDHTFGWPFLLLDLVQSARGERPLSVVGPPGVATFFGEMMRLGSVLDIQRDAEGSMALRFVETAGAELHRLDCPVPLEAVRVEHVPELECYGFVLELAGTRLGYSGDTRPCEGLEALAGECDTLVLECNGTHAAKSHMDVESVLSLHARHPDLRVITTHVGRDVSAELLPGIELPDDFAVIDL